MELVKNGAIADLMEAGTVVKTAFCGPCFLSLIHIFGGFPVVGVYANVYDGSYHEVDSSELAFHIAGSLAFKDAMKQGAPVLLEPIMKVEVTMPEEYMGDILSLIHISAEAL